MKINLFNKIKQPVCFQDIQIEWQNQKKTEITEQVGFNYLYAPKNTNALFSGNRLVYYGFMPNCSQATFKATINGYEFSTLVTCSELSIASQFFSSFLLNRNYTAERQCFKDPDLSRYIYYLYTLFPNAKFIYIIRDVAYS